LKYVLIQKWWDANPNLRHQPTDSFGFAEGVDGDSSEFMRKNIKNYPRYVECGGHRFRRESAETVPPLSGVHKFKEKAAANLLRHPASLKLRRTKGYEGCDRRTP
jgi:hypothetical protein